MSNIAIFASGSGTNAEKMISYFNSGNISVKLILTNNKEAFVIERAKKHNVSYYVFDREEFKSGGVTQILKNNNIDLIVLAGFLWLIPEDLINSYPNKIINIHPALLPKYGGKGMYGDNVHKAVIKNKEKESGITIHYVNNEYDKGNIILQARCPVKQNDTPEILAQRIHKLEHEYFPKVIEDLLS